MIVSTINVNGIRAAVKRRSSDNLGLLAWLASTTADVVRRLHPDQPGPYAWWSSRGRAFDNDAGWRIDYQLATPGLAARAVAARVERADA